MSSRYERVAANDDVDEPSGSSSVSAEVASAAPGGAPLSRGGDPASVASAQRPASWSLGSVVGVLWSSFRDGMLGIPDPASALTPAVRFSRSCLICSDPRRRRHTRLILPWVIRSFTRYRRSLCLRIREYMRSLEFLVCMFADRSCRCRCSRSRWHPRVLRSHVPQQKAPTL